MDVTFGVNVDGTEAQIALLDAAAPHPVIDQSQTDLANDPIHTLASTLVSTDRMLAESGHRLVGTTVSGSDTTLMARLHQALVDAELTNVALVSHADAVTAVTRSMAGNETVASITSDETTAALSIVDSAADVTSVIAVEPVADGDRAAAYRTLLERFSEEPGGATSVIVLGPQFNDPEYAALSSTSPVPLRFPEDPEFALARGAALAGFGQQHANPAIVDYPADSVNSVGTMVGVQAQQLAYSQVEDANDFGLASAVLPMQTPMRPLSDVDPDEYETEEEDAPANRPRALLLGSTVAAVVVVGFAALAVSVAIAIRPTANAQDVRLQEEVVAGKYFPNSPGQGVNPDGPNWTMIEELPKPGIEPDARVFRTHSLSPSYGTGDAGAELIKFYRDGTVGVVPNALTPPPDVGPDVIGVPMASDYLTRLIPDFSRWTPCQVLALVGNMRRMAEIAADSASSTSRETFEMWELLTGNTGNAITGWSDIGEVAVVPVGTGPLFATPQHGADTGTDLAAIPDQVFKTGSSDVATSRVLPSDVKIVDPKDLESLPAFDGVDAATSAPILGEVIPGVVEESLPGVQGTGPIVVPDSKIPGSAPSPEATLPGSRVEIPEVVPGNPSLDGPRLPVNVPSAPQLPGGDAPGELPLPNRELPIEIPKPPLPVEVPKPAAPQIPIEIPKPQVPVIEAPAPPVIQAPPPPVIQAPPPPVIQAPPPPVIEMPTFTIPTQLFPAPNAPAAPELPSFELPQLPELPFNGGLFGSGSN